jgi:ribose transport system permease protein
MIQPMRTLKTAASGPAAICIGLYVLAFIVYAAVQGNFAITPFGVSVLLNDSITLAIAAAALTFVVLTGGFDLSIAGTVALCNSILAVTNLSGTAGAVEGLMIVLLVGAAVGIVNGIFVAYVRLQSIAVTLGTMLMTAGVALLVLNAPGGQVPDSIANGFTGLLGPIPTAAIILLLLTFILWFILAYTKFGISIFAIGQDRTAARASGLNVERTEFGAYVIAGAVAGLSGYMVSAETGTGDPNYNSSFLLLAFASVAIGGTSFRGGRGTVIGSVVGALLLGLIQKMLFALGVASFFTGMFEGALMIVAVLIGSLSGLLSAPSGQNWTGKLWFRKATLSRG